LLQEIESPFSTVIVGVAQDKVVGFASAMFVYDEAHITNLAVAPEFRGMGFGRAIFADMLERIDRVGFKAITLEVRSSNRVALELYSKSGFVAVGVRRGYYTDNNEDAVIMWRQT
jgi:ribosomal-protein-alanine N-acetyltransferase